MIKGLKMGFLSQTDPEVSLNVQNEVSQEVSQLCHRFPVPGIDD